MTAAIQKQGDPPPEPLVVMQGGQAETRAEFHERRAKGIGGSDVAAILGLSRYKTPEALWLEKTGQVAGDDTLTADRDRGNTFERIAIERYAERSGKSVMRAGDRGSHPLYPWMLYTVDAVEIDNGEEVICEVKCPSLGMYSRIKREGLPEEWRLQMQHYLCATECSRGRFIIFCADRMELVDFEVVADPELHALLIEKEQEFWTLVETMTPPANVVAEIALNKIVLVGEVEKRNDAEFLEAMAMLREAKAVEATAEQVVLEAKERVLEVVGERHGIFEAEGIGRLHHSQREGRKTLDEKALANARPLDRVAVGVALMPYFESGVIPEKVVESIGKCDLDLSQFKKQGRAFDEIRTYFSGGSE